VLTVTRAGTEKPRWKSQQARSAAVSPDGAEVAGIVYTLASERADLRAWRTLPHSFHAARVFVAPGTHSVRLAPLGGATMDLGRFELARGETMFVFARTLGTRTYARAVGGRPLTTGPTP
jgi:hypothetical protein